RLDRGDANPGVADGPLGPARRGDLGEPRRPARLHVLPADELVAVERAIRIARQRGLPGDIPGWSAIRDRIYHPIMERCWHPDRRAFVQHYDPDVLNASVLLMPLCKFVAPTDPGWTSTLDAITAELVTDSLVYRYNVDASPDGLAGREATFSTCSFWWVEALARGRAARRGAAGLREDAHLRQPHRAVLRRDRANRRAARQLPPGPHPPGVNRRRLQPGPPARVSAGEPVLLVLRAASTFVPCGCLTACRLGGRR